MDRVCRTDLTKGEKLFLTRMRKKKSQRRMAQYLGVPRFRYQRWENDKETPPMTTLIGSLRPYERCMIYRRRTGVKQTVIAEDMKLSRYWVHRMERGEVDCTPLLSYWES